MKEVGVFSSNFNIEHEISKIKIPIPFTELIKNHSYRDPTLKIMNSPTNCIPSDVINLQDENLTIFFGPKIFDQLDDKCGYPPPFYITLTVHDQTLHNCLLDFGASHNLMPKEVMEDLGLTITKPYHDLHNIYSRALKFVGVIKHLVFSLTQLLMKVYSWMLS